MIPLPLSQIPPHIVCAADYAREAERRLPPDILAWLDGGAGDETTLRANIAALQAIRITPRVLQPLRPDANTRVALLGRTLPHPFILAPVAYQSLLHPAGEIATAQGAGVMDAVFTLSGFASVEVERVVAAAGAPVWMQLYVLPDRDATLRMVERAEAAGCEALVVTVDAPISGIRNREQRAGFVLPPHVRAVNVPQAAGSSEPVIPSGQSSVFAAAMRGAPDWGDIAGLVAATRLPVLLKGVLHPDDARRACDAGAAGVIVSNHGGRVLDGVPASIEALPAIVEAVGGTAPVLMDGGVRRGGDAFRALALGAQAVMVGRPYLHALSVAGPLGVAHLIRTLREELEITMALTGCSDLADIRKVALHATVAEP